MLKSEVVEYKHDGYEWVVGTAAASQVHQGQTLSVWVQFHNAADGRAYFGFGAATSSSTLRDCWSRQAERAGGRRASGTRLRFRSRSISRSGSRIVCRTRRCWFAAMGCRGARIRPTIETSGWKRSSGPGCLQARFIP